MILSRLIQISRDLSTARLELNKGCLGARHGEYRAKADHPHNRTGPRSFQKS